MELDYAVNQPQAHAGAFAEDAPRRVRLQPAAAIFDRHHHFAAFHRGAQSDRALRRRVLRGVLEERGERLRQARSIGVE